MGCRSSGHGKGRQRRYPHPAWPFPRGRKAGQPARSALHPSGRTRRTPGRRQPRPDRPWRRGRRSYRVFRCCTGQSKFGHAADFGVTGNYNQSTAQEFVNAMSNHIDNATPISGTYRGTIDVTHYFDSTTNLNVMFDTNGNFISGWRLSADQAANLLRSGNVQ
jgi:Colicin D